MKPLEAAARRQIQKTPPVWMMRQAGRYHRHYQNLRAKHSFMELCKTPELAAEVAWGPVQDFDFDVAILFSDLLFPLEALGLGLEYTDQGPKLGFQLTSETIKKLIPWPAALKQLEFQKEAVRLTREKIPAQKSVIGFVGGPWTLAVYAVEGSHAGNLIQSKKQPQLFRDFSEILLPLLIENIRLQLDGGAETVMIFDTAAGELSPDDFQNAVVPLLKKMAEAFPGRLGYYSKGTQPAHLLSAKGESLLSAPWAGVGVDHRWRLKEFFPLSQKGFVQGNFDQSLLHLPAKEFEIRFRDYLKPFQELSGEQRAGWVCGLGHGVLPKTPEDNVRRFVQIVRESFR
jgi:uroporphyrinogen decarboxylase